MTFSSKMSNTVPKTNIILGTAQLGMNYGVANSIGQPSLDQCVALIRTAAELGINSFDTAMAYGESESRLGFAIRELGIENTADVMTKFGPHVLRSERDSIAALKSCLDRLAVPRLSVIYSHSFEELTHSSGAARALSLLRASQLVERIGASVYSAKEALSALDLEVVDVVQMPLNAFDQNALNEGVLGVAKNRGKEVFFRSVFLQGFLTLPSERLPTRLFFAKQFLENWHELCERHGCSLSIAALQIARYLAGEAPILIGCESQQQLRENVDAIVNPCSNIRVLAEEAARIAVDVPEKLRNPSLWPKE